MNSKIINILDTDGRELEVEVITLIEIDLKKYIVYTKNEKQKNGNLIVYISKLRINDGVYSIENIESEEEWKKVKSTLGKIANK